MMSAGQAQQAAERRAQLPLATDVERLVATLMAPQASLSRKLSAAERLYSLIPTYVWRMLTAAAIKLLGKDALLDDGSDTYKNERRLYAEMLGSLLKYMDKTREKIVEVKLPPIPISIPEGPDGTSVPKIRNDVADALINWFYEATEEARKSWRPLSYDTEKPGYILLITFASLVIVNGLRQLVNIVD
jgi:hypothetical protein